MNKRITEKIDFLSKIQQCHENLQRGMIKRDLMKNKHHNSTDITYKRMDSHQIIIRISYLFFSSFLLMRSIEKKIATFFCN